MESPDFRERPYPVVLQTQRTGSHSSAFRPVGLVRCIKKTHLQRSAELPASSSVSAFLVILYHICLVQYSYFQAILIGQTANKFPDRELAQIRNNRLCKFIF